MRNMKGFSLIELLVVVAIIGVLAAAGVVGYQNYTETAKQNVVKNNFANVVRFVRNQAGVKASGIENECGQPKFGNCSAASAVTEFVAYFDTNGFDNPYHSTAGTKAVESTTAASAASVAACSSSDGDKRGRIAMYQDGASTPNIILYGCDQFENTTAASATIIWD